MAGQDRLRWWRLVLTFVLVFAALGVGLAVVPVSAATAYTIIDLGALPGHDQSTAHALNNRGQVIGSSGTGTAVRTFLWSDGAMTALLPEGAPANAPNGINERTQIVIGQVGPEGYPVTRLWQNGIATPLEGIPAGTSTVAGGINNAGQIAISLVPLLPQGPITVARWQAGKLTDLGVTKAAAIGIDGAGRIVGAVNAGPFEVGFAEALPRPFFWDGSTLMELPTTPTAPYGLAIALNERGQIAGRVSTTANNNRFFRAAIWQDGALQELERPYAAISTTATGINAFGQVVGWTIQVQDNSSHGFLWEEGLSVDLFSLLPPGHGWEQLRPQAINDAGQIAGTGLIQGKTHAFLMTPVAPAGRYFPETDRTVAGPFLAQWEASGGLAINGYPLSDPFVEVLEDGKPYLVQYFERVRMEYHPENAAPYNVLLGQFGRRIHPADPPVDELPGLAYFPETGHNVPPSFIAFWHANGGLGQFGFPLSEVITEQLEDGNSYEVQYFERARFEWHPENSPPYNVLLGQFGRAICAERCR